jgi:gas vesicle protein
LEGQESDFMNLSNLHFRCDQGIVANGQFLINNRGVKTMSSGKVLLYIVVGAAVGAVLGVLFAPAKGSVTRKRITRRGTDYAEDVKEKFNEYIDAITEEYDTIKEGAMDLVDKGKEKAASVAGAKHAK